MQRSLIVGDIHGCLDKLKACLDKANFSDSDALYFTGDFCDRGPQSIDTLEYLMKLKNFFAVLGNHDLWLYRFLKYNDNDLNWLANNGGNITVTDFWENHISLTETENIIAYLESLPLIIEGPSFYIAHASLPFNGDETLSSIKQWKALNWRALSQKDLKPVVWDRTYGLCARAFQQSRLIDPYLKVESWIEKAFTFPFVKPWKTDKKIFVGHTPMLDGPLICGEYHLINVDTGSYYPNGYLTVMDMDSLQYWQS